MTRGDALPRLRSRTVRLDPPVDPFDLAGETGFVWSGPGGELVGVVTAARILVGPRVERAAEAAAALLAGAEVDDPAGAGLGPVAVGALPFSPGAPGELHVPALLLRRDPAGATWVTATAPAPAAPPPAAELLARAGLEAFVYASGGLVGASPELLVSRRGRVAISRPMAGTVPRGATAAAEARGLARLTGSAKEAVEHRLVVDAVAEGLAKVADRVEVAHPEVVRLPTVAHLATEVTADLTEPLPSALGLAGLLHPTPAVGGSPRDAAVAAIAALEPFDRGRYAGPVGWVDAAGDGEWAVALRCAALDGRRARLLAGAGIVPGSDPDAEWAETEHKLAAMLEVLLGP